MCQLNQVQEEVNPLIWESYLNLEHEGEISDSFYNSTNSPSGESIKLWLNDDNFGHIGRVVIKKSGIVITYNPGWMACKAIRIKRANNRPFNDRRKNIYGRSIHPMVNVKNYKGDGPGRPSNSHKSWGNFLEDAKNHRKRRKWGNIGMKK